MAKYAAIDRYLKVLSAAIGILIGMAARAHPLEIPADHKPERTHKWVQQQMQKRVDKAGKTLTLHIAVSRQEHT